MIKWLGHLHTITKHRNQVIRNGWHCGIFLHCLRHDLSKYGPTEFLKSAHYYAGDHSPVYEQRKAEHCFSSVCQHHTRRNKHHWEYWTDYFKGVVICKTMPYKYATEYVCDMLAASKTYDPKHFSGQVALNYFLARCDHYFMTRATKEYVKWCLQRFAQLGWKGLKKKDTKAKYDEIVSRFDDVEAYDCMPIDDNMPDFVANLYHHR